MKEFSGATDRGSVLDQLKLIMLQIFANWSKAEKVIFDACTGC
jgi:hypothetical protein